MSECSFSLPLQGDPQASFAAAKREITRQGGTVAGTAQQGTAALNSPVGTIDVRYAMQGQTLHVDVIDKPWVVSCSKIEAGLKQALASAPPAPTQPSASSKAYQVVNGPEQVVAASVTRRGKVTLLDTQYIEGAVHTSSRPMWYALLAAAFGLAVVGGGIYWWKRRR